MGKLALAVPASMLTWLPAPTSTPAAFWPWVLTARAPMLETLPLLRAEMPAEFWPVVLMAVSAPAPVPLSTAMVPASEASRPCESWPAVSMRSDPLVRTLPLCVAWLPSDVSPRVLIVLTSGPLPMDTVPLVRATTPWELAPAVSVTRPPLV